MKVLISWSGKQSQGVANALRKWLPAVIPSSQPWVSSVDIAAGERWFPTLMQQLESTEFCIICLTPDNLRSPWLYFEAGAIAARHRDAKVCGFLTGIGPSQVPGPFAQFQCVQADVDGARLLVQAINDSFADSTYDEQELDAWFTASWPRLRESLKESLLLYDPRSTASEIETEPPAPTFKLSHEASELLVEAADDKNGTILMARTMSGLILQTNGRQMCERKDPRSEARWQGAVRELVQYGLIEDRGHKGEVFNVTAEGFRAADKLKSKPE
ncbi:MAG: toll/interleukin-1 receptor domain-containing protein [Planctomycetes bacterium]|nr:toll/interleukin-1 receptor domain-containing protein [Planctomycetota bacterium]